MLECAGPFSIFAGVLSPGASTHSEGNAEGRMKNLKGGQDYRFPIADRRVGSSAFPGAIRDGVFFDVEADFGLGRLRGRFQEGAELLEDLPQSHIVDE